METITRAQMLRMFLTSTATHPVHIVYMQYSPSRGVSEGPVVVPRCYAIPRGASSRGRYLTYIDLDDPGGHPVTIHEATLMFINHHKVLYRHLATL